MEDIKSLLEKFVTAKLNFDDEESEDELIQIALDNYEVAINRVKEINEDKPAAEIKQSKDSQVKTWSDQSDDVGLTIAQIQLKKLVSGIVEEILPGMLRELLPKILQEMK